MTAEARLLMRLLGVDTRTGRSGACEAFNIIADYLSFNGLKPEIGENNGFPFLFMRMKGRGRMHGNFRRKGLLLFSHIDTADWDTTDWCMSPLGGRTTDGIIYGRGAIDCKGLCAVQAVLVAEVAAKAAVDKPPCEDLGILITSDEEAGGKDGMGYIVRHPEYLDSFRYALGEGGGYILPADDKDDADVITVQLGERGRMCFSAVGEAISGLEMSDRGLLRRLLIRQRTRTLDRRIDPAGFYTVFYSDHDGAVLNIAPGANMARVRKQLYRLSILDEDIAGTEVSHACKSRACGKLYRAIIREAVSNGYRGNASVSPGFSDARYLRRAGLDVYGYFPIGLRERISAMHKPDEHIHENTLAEALSSLQVIVNYVIN